VVRDLPGPIRGRNIIRGPQGAGFEASGRLRFRIRGTV
jgi:hypothetical protein